MSRISRSSVAVNLSMVFGDQRISEAIEAVARKGFSAIEVWFLRYTDVEALDRASRKYRLPLSLFAADIGDFELDTWGYLGMPDKEKEFFTSIYEAAVYAERWHVPYVSVLSGRREPGWTLVDQIELSAERLCRAAAVAADGGWTLLIEPFAQATRPWTLLQTAEEAKRLVQLVSRPEVGLLFDTHHRYWEARSIVDQLADCWPHVRYIQLGDAPSRTVPGTGSIDFAEIVSLLRDSEYSGGLSLEYEPTLGRWPTPSWWQIWD